jgi:monomeric sarcosine oxidase
MFCYTQDCQRGDQQGEIGRRYYQVRQQRVVIVGAGIVGLSTAYALLSQGVKHVTVLEQETVDHGRSTSRGISRLLRLEYGSDVFYSEMVRLSLSRWKRLERISKRTLYTPTGLLLLGAEGDNFTQASFHTMRELHMPVECLSQQQCKQRFPQFVSYGSDIIAYNAEAGILHASTCLHALKELIIGLGGTIIESCRVTHISNDGQLRPVRIHTSSGSEIGAERVVLAIGPWVHRLLADLDLPVRLTRQYLLYFAGLPVTSFCVNVFPAFMTSDLYGFPIHYPYNNSYGPHWLKAASHTFGASTDPDDILPPDERVVARVVRKLRDLLPALQQAELVHVDSCMYDVTPDENFILDHLPGDPRIVFATGLTGHGFKFGPLLGELLSSMVCNTPPPVPLGRFRLERASLQKQHASVA